MVSIPSIHILYLPSSFIHKFSSRIKRQNVSELLVVLEYGFTHILKLCYPRVSKRVCLLLEVILILAKYSYSMLTFVPTQVFIFNECLHRKLRLITKSNRPSLHTFYVIDEIRIPAFQHQVPS
jgi:hypothetical protein